MKIYTRGGDKGQTSLIGGKRVRKDHIRVNAYGTIDELNAAIGVALSVMTNESMKKELHHIQHTLFDCGADLANPEVKGVGMTAAHHVTWLEERIDFYSTQTPLLEKFVLPGGAPAASHLHLARTIARRAERGIVTLAESEEVSNVTRSYINRLSDYLFAAARFINKEASVEEPVYDKPLKG